MTYESFPPSWTRATGSLLVCTALACSGAADSDASKIPSAPSLVTEERVPGWYEVPEEPAGVVYGNISAEVQNGALVGELQAEGLPRDQRVYLAMRWGSETPIVITDLLTPGKNVPFRASLGCDGKREVDGGVLRVYLAPKGATVADPATDELLGLTSKPGNLFDYGQRAYDQKLPGELCTTVKKELLPITLQRDPRLRLALCDEPLVDGSACGQPLLDKTRLFTVSVEASPDSMQLVPSFVWAPDGEAIAVEANGVLLSTNNGRLSRTIGLGPFHPGENVVRITIGRLPSWEAKLVLPKNTLQPRLRESGLRMGQSFSMDWADSSWANRFVVTFEPLDLPPTRAGIPTFETKESHVTDTFVGFDDGAGGKRTGPRARIVLRASQEVTEKATNGPYRAGGYWLQWFESMTVSVQP